MQNMYMSNASFYLLDTLFNLYVFALVLRFLFQALQVGFNNPISTFLVKITSPVLKPLRGLLPNTGNIDLASLLFAVVLTSVKLMLELKLSSQTGNIAGIIVLAISDVMGMILTILFWAIIARAVMSWVNPDPHQPIVQVLYSLSEPLMAPARRLIPPFGGLDLSPIVIFILITLTRMLVLAPLTDFGAKLL